MRIAKTLIRNSLYFFGFFFAYKYLWAKIEQDLLNRIGYIIWLHFSAEDFLNFLRINTMKQFLVVLIPILFGILGVLWGRRLVQIINVRLRAPKKQAF